MAQAFSPTEIFKRATAATLRAIAERDDVHRRLRPGAGRAQPAARVRAAEPGARPAGRGGGATARRRRQRGAAAALSRRRGAFRSAPPADHWRARSSRRSSRRGSRRWAPAAWSGSRPILPPMLDEQYRRQGFERITERTESTMAEAVRLLAREALTQRTAAALGAACRRSVAPLARRQDRQGHRRARPHDPRPGRLCAGDAPADPGSRPRSRRVRRVVGRQPGAGGREDAEGENQSEGEGATLGRAALARRLARRQCGRGRARMTATPTRRRDDAGRQRRRSWPSRTPRHTAARPAGRERRLSRLQHGFRRGHRGRRTLRRRRIVAAAAPARPAIGAPAERHRAARQPPAAPAAGEADARLGIRSRRGPARRRPAVARRRQPGPAALLQAGAGNRVPRHRRYPADRQFRLDARPADHGGGDERRHPGAHPRTLRASRSRSSALRRGPGRAGSRASAGSPPASRPIRAASTICATSSTSRPTRRGGAPGAVSG